MTGKELKHDLSPLPELIPIKVRIGDTMGWISSVHYMKTDEVPHILLYATSGASKLFTIQDVTTDILLAELKRRMK